MHQMNAKYWWYTERPKRTDDRIVATLGKQGTLKRIDEKCPLGLPDQKITLN